MTNFNLLHIISLIRFKALTSVPLICLGNCTVRHNLRRIQRSFSSLLVKAFVACNRKPVPVNELRMFLTQRCVDQKSTIPLFQQSMLEIINHSSLEQIIMLMSRIGAWSFLNFHLLEEISTEFEIHQLVEPIAAYTQEVEHFKEETTLVDFLSVWNGRSGADSIPDCKPVIVKLKEKWPQFTLADVSKKAGFLANEFHLKPVFQLANGNAGSVYIMWLVPVAAASHMQILMESQNRPDLVSSGINELVIGERIYQVCYLVNTMIDKVSFIILYTSLSINYNVDRLYNYLRRPLQYEYI